MIQLALNSSALFLLFEPTTQKDLCEPYLLYIESNVVKTFIFLIKMCVRWHFFDDYTI